MHGLIKAGGIKQWRLAQMQGGSKKREIGGEAMRDGRENKKSRSGIMRCSQED